ncbi:hypothetical protein PSA7680_03316 [Pseudoruegeria aquimaris]|uniref:Uncharacterized protein n=1 Tax=Pseudoruegeria aquimaris TaxID=393663 RepID=A0A1Y5TL41_9RHOB|nr:hypothetical protein [Pseudoruegeria aquimaris]SLN62892.1 hypothetical protein PSA7680_03316 [Pseudoruegeria aquimaris]
MTAVLTISEHDHKRLYLFAVDAPPEEAEALVTRREAQDGGLDWPLPALIGATTLNPEFVEAFDVSELADFGLMQYLHEGGGIPEDQLAPFAEQLNALTGWVVLITSAAFEGTPQELWPQPPLRLLARFEEESPAPPPPFGLESQSAEGVLESPPTKKQVSDAAMSGRIAMLMLILMFALTGVVIWISAG